MASTKSISLQAVKTNPIEQPVSVLKGVGGAFQKKLAKLNIYSIQDLLFHLPFRYEDRTRITPIGAARPYDTLVLEGEVVGSAITFGKRRSLLVRFQDNTGLLSLRFYHFNAAQKNALSRGTKLRCYGEVRPGSSGLELYHPEYLVLKATPPPLTQTLTPVYPVTEGISQYKIRDLVEQSLVLLDQSDDNIELLPASIAKQYKLPSLKAAIYFVHHPPKNISLALMEQKSHPSQQRLAFEELIAHSLSLLQLRQRQQQQAAPALPLPAALIKKFQQQLGFKLTQAQLHVWREIQIDLQQSLPMLRMLQGDVGSGKTVVATLAALQAIGNGLQAVLMAPTEILAEQHYLNLQQWLEPLNITIGFLSGSLKVKPRKTSLQAIAAGDYQMIVGTHALLQDAVIFNKVGLIIIDEQHRFGVHQRLALKQKAVRTPHRACHQLIMTATPIPRTLTMSAYGDLDNSIIDELPPGRIPVRTLVLPAEKRREVINRVQAACTEKKQAYWVCTLIEESETLQCQAAEITAESLQEQLPKLTIGLVHGRMKTDAKAAVMEQFKCGEIDLLVATTVIEVGVNVPNASLMIIENPERLGLAQLHQLRGRVGRGAVESFCVLLYEAPLSITGKQRLAIMRETNDGFKIAEKDLELRGPGEVLGTRQTGDIGFRIADLIQHKALVEPARDSALLIQQQQPAQAGLLVKRWLSNTEEYGNV